MGHLIGHVTVSAGRGRLMLVAGMAALIAAAAAGVAPADPAVAARSGAGTWLVAGMSATPNWPDAAAPGEPGPLTGRPAITTQFPLLFTSPAQGTMTAIGPTWTARLNVGTDPAGVAFTPDGQYAYVADDGLGADTVQVISGIAAGDPRVSATLRVGTAPSQIAVTPDGRYAFVTNNFSGTVSVISGASSSDPKVTGALRIGGTPGSVAVTPNGRYAYVADYNSDKVHIIYGAESGKPAVSARVLKVGKDAYEVAISPDGQDAYVTNLGSNTVSVISGAETAAPRVTRALRVGKEPTGVAVAPAGRRLYVTNSGARTVSVISEPESARPDVRTLTIGKEAIEVAVTPDGQHAYVTDIGTTPGRVSVIDGADTATPTVAAAGLKVAAEPFGVAVDPGCPATVKGNSPVPGAGQAEPAGPYYYASAHQFATAAGAAGSFTVADPKVAAGECHSLAELAVESRDGRQIIEEGWSVDPGLFHDTAPHLFVFHWVDHHPGCYDACKFVPAGTAMTAGMKLVPGTRQTFEIKFANNKWEISDNGIAVGYFPGSLWKSFTSLGLVQWFGEVSAATSRPCSQMGNGRFGGRPVADKITGMRFIGGPVVSFSLTTTEPAYYTARKTSGAAIRFGGPGACLP